jgi:hypothetical protein
MRQRLIILMASLLAMLHMSTAFASTKLNVDHYEEVAKSQKYNNVCLIRSYNEKVLISHSTGTFCKRGNKSFILSAQYVKGGTRHTAHFGDGVEREIEDFKVLTEFMEEDTKDQRVSSTRTQGRSELVMGFLSSYPENVVPARLVSLKTGVLNNDHQAMLENQEILLLWNLMQVKNQVCHLVGFGNLVSSLSHPNLLLSYQNKGLKKTVVTGKVSYEPSEKVEGGRDLFFSTFAGCGAQNATQCERPITGGFIGGSLRTENEEVIAVASHCDDFEVTEKFRQSHPLAGTLLGSLKRLVDRCAETKVFYKVKLRHLALAGVVAYACFNPSEIGAIAGFGLSAISLNLMKPLYDHIFKNLYPLGSRSYYIPILPLMSEIDAHLEAYADSSTENTSKG